MEVSSDQAAVKIILQKNVHTWKMIILFFSQAAIRLSEIDFESNELHDSIRLF